MFICLRGIATTVWFSTETAHLSTTNNDYQKLDQSLTTH